jgi:hypothetical protein
LHATLAAASPFYADLLIASTDDHVRFALGLRLIGLHDEIAQQDKADVDSSALDLHANVAACRM